MMISRMAPITAPGTASMKARVFGNTATMINMAPMTDPTLREATPVRLINEMQEGV